MDRKIITENLEEAIFNVLETMFFEPVQIINKEISLLNWFSDKQPLFGANLAFIGPMKGFFYMFVPNTVATEITANFLGIDEEEIDDEQRMDTVKEALNMIGGNVFSFFDKKGEFKLGIPKLMGEEKNTYEMLEKIKGDTVFIESMDNRLAAGVAIET